MSEYKSGFYIYTPGKDAEEGMHELSLPQVIQIIDGEVWLTGVLDSFDIDYVAAIGLVGKMVMSKNGKII